MSHHKNSVAVVVWTSLCLCAVSSAAVPPNNHHQHYDASGSLWDSTWGGLSEEEVLDELGDLDDLPLIGDDDDCLATSDVACSAVDDSLIAPPPPPTTTTTTTIAPQLDKDEVEEEPWKRKNDWWKDPLSMFDDNDELVVENDEGEKEGEIDDEELLESVMEVDDEDVEAEPLKEAEEERLALERAKREEAALKALQQQQEALRAKQQKEEARLAKQQQKEELRAQKAKQRQEEETLRKMTKQQQEASANHGKEPSPGFRKPNLAFLNLRNDDTPKNDGSSKSSPSTSVALISVPALATSVQAALSQGTLLASSVPALGVLATMFLGKALYERIIRSNQNAEEQQPSSGLSDQEEDEYNNVLMEHSAQYTTNNLHYSDFEEEEESSSEFGMDLDSDIDSSAPTSNHRHNHQSPKSASPTRSTSYSSSSSSPAFFTGIRSVLVGGNSRPGVPAGGGGLLARKIKVSADELEFLRLEAEKAVVERQAMEQEYEKTSFQLQEAQSEVSQLASTTKYLKSQLKDYEEMMDRTIRNERRKSKAEIQRMKEIMEATRNEEREIMRRQFLKELEKMQAQYEAERAERQAIETINQNTDSQNGESLSDDVSKKSSSRKKSSRSLKSDTTNE